MIFGFSAYSRKKMSEDKSDQEVFFLMAKNDGPIRKQEIFL